MASAPDKRLCAHKIKFRARAIERQRLCEVLNRAFGARRIKIISLPMKSRERDVVQTAWSPRSGTVADRLLQRLGDGQVHLRAELLQLGTTSSVSSAIAKLLRAGHIISPDWGCYARTGAKVAGYTKPVNASRVGPALKAVLQVLDQPRSAAEVRQLVGGTRQGVDQKLKKLIRRRLVRRVDSVGERGRHIYLRADEKMASALASRPPALRDNAARLLSKLPADTATRLVDVIGVGPGASSLRQTVQSLVRQGLVSWSGTHNKRVVRLSNLGREHPQYDIAAAKSPPLRQTLISTDELRLFLALHALGEARSLDLTLALGIGRGRKSGGVGTGNHIQHLEAVGLIEAANDKVRKHPHYRLTTAGLSHIATLRGEIEFPDPDRLRQQLEQETRKYRAEAHGRMMARMRSSKPPDGARITAILELLASAGPLNTRTIGQRMAKPYLHKRSLNLALLTLRKRGEIIVLRPHDSRCGQSTLWSLAPAFSDSLSTGQSHASNAQSSGRSA